MVEAAGFCFQDGDEISPDQKTLTRRFPDGSVFTVTKYGRKDITFSLVLDAQTKVQTIVNIWTKPNGEKSELSVQNFLTQDPNRLVNSRLHQGEQHVQIEYHDTPVTDRPTNLWKIRVYDRLKQGHGGSWAWSASDTDKNSFRSEIQAVSHAIIGFAQQAVKEMAAGRMPDFSSLNDVLGTNFCPPSDPKPAAYQISPHRG